MRVRASGSPIRETATVGRLGQRRQVVVPRKLCEELGLREGDFLEVTRNKDRIIIKPKKLVDPEDTLTPKEERIVANGFRQLKKGQYVTWDQLKHELDL